MKGIATTYYPGLQGRITLSGSGMPVDQSEPRRQSGKGGSNDARLAKIGLLRQQRTGKKTNQRYRIDPQRPFHHGGFGYADDYLVANRMQLLADRANETLPTLGTKALQEMLPTTSPGAAAAAGASPYRFDPDRTVVDAQDTPAFFYH
jgi:hypothetical protein